MKVNADRNGTFGNIDFFFFFYALSLFFTDNRFSVYRIDGSISLQWHHLIFGLLFAYVVVRRYSIIIPSIKLGLFFLYLVLCSFVNAFIWGFGSMTINAVYAFLVVCVTYTYCKHLDIDCIKRSIYYAFMTVLVLIYINIFVQANEIIIFLMKPYGHPRLNVFVGGGVNLEATLLGMFSVIALEKKNGLVIWALTSAVSMLYASRTGIIINILVLAWYLLFQKKRDWKYLFRIIAVSIFVIIVALSTKSGRYMINRFLHGSTAVGTINRKKIWIDSFLIFAKYPLGVGCGNIMRVISKLLHHIYAEDNAHNMYIQYMAEEGIIGIIFLLSGLFFILRNEVKSRFANIFGVFVLIYLFQGLFQSRGIDGWAAFMLGIYFYTINCERDLLIY